MFLFYHPQSILQFVEFYWLKGCIMFNICYGNTVIVGRGNNFEINWNNMHFLFFFQYLFEVMWSACYSDWFFSIFMWIQRHSMIPFHSIIFHWLFCRYSFLFIEASSLKLYYSSICLFSLRNQKFFFFISTVVFLIRIQFPLQIKSPSFKTTIEPNWNEKLSHN